MQPLKGIEKYIKGFKEEDLDKAHKEFLVKRIQDFPEFLDLPCTPFQAGSVFVMANMFQVVSNLGDLTYITKLSMELVSWNENLLKLMSFLSYTIVLLVVVEPEKMKTFNLVATVVFSLIGNRLLIK
jgi:hypothetical protein